MRSEVADATGNVKYIRKSLCTSLNSVLVTGVLLKASHVVTSQVFTLISNWCNIKVVMQNLLYELKLEYLYLRSVLTYNSLSRIIWPENKTHGSYFFFSPYFPRVRSLILALRRSHYFENMKQAIVISEKYRVSYWYKNFARKVSHVWIMNINCIVRLQCCWYSWCSLLVIERFAPANLISWFVFFFKGHCSVCRLNSTTP